MLHLGRRRLGDYQFLFCQCLNGRQPVAPDSAPAVTIYNGSGTPVIGARPLPQIGNNTGLFGFDELLGSAYADGFYSALFTWTVSGVQKADLAVFEVLAGGDSNGAYTSLCFYDRPEAQYLIGNLDAGTLEYRSGPSI